MKKNYQIKSDFLAKLMLPKDPNIPSWCSSKIEKILIFRKGEVIEVDESQKGIVKIIFKKFLEITPEEYRNNFLESLSPVESSKNEIVSDITDLG